MHHMLTGSKVQITESFEKSIPVVRVQFWRLNPWRGEWLNLWRVEWFNPWGVNGSISGGGGGIGFNLGQRSWCMVQGFQFVPCTEDINHLRVSPYWKKKVIRLEKWDADNGGESARRRRRMDESGKVIGFELMSFTFLILTFIVK